MQAPDCIEGCGDSGGGNAGAPVLRAHSLDPGPLAGGSAPWPSTRSPRGPPGASLGGSLLWGGPSGALRGGSSSPLVPAWCSRRRGCFRVPPLSLLRCRIPATVPCDPQVGGLWVCGGVGWPHHEAKGSARHWCHENHGAPLRRKALRAWPACLVCLPAYLHASPPNWRWQRCAILESKDLSI